MSYPDFVCMGFQKCGTTTLYDLFKQHPEVVLCRDVKEPMQYRVPLMSIFGRKYYRWRYFKDVPPDDPRLKGEINAGLTYNGCAKKLKRDYDPNTKMIFMMRNPVDRSYSSYKYFLARGFLPLKWVKLDAKLGHAECFDRYVHSVLDNPRESSKIMKHRLTYLVFSQSMYGASISEYLPNFNVNKMKFIVFEDFVRDEHKTCRELYDFLGISDKTDISYTVKSNEGKDRVVSGLWSKYFLFMKSANYVLYDLCNIIHWAPKFYSTKFLRHYRWVRKKALRTDTDKSTVKPETREYLMNYYNNDICMTEKITGLDLHTAWGQKS